LDVKFRFFLVWRGWGPLALASLILPTALLAIVIQWSIPAAMLSYGIAAVVAGAVCIYCRNEWNQGSGEHMMYWIPLEIWGWLWIVLGAVLSITGIVKLM